VIGPQSVGLGAANSRIRFYIANRPPIDDYPTLTHLKALAPGEIAHIVSNTSNHWRKAFNVLAKFLFDVYRQQGRNDLPATWQAYRDLELLHPHSREALLFSAPDFSDDQVTHIVLGKTYAATLNLPPLAWLDAHFAVNNDKRLIVSPYPDYRQLSNERIRRLSELARQIGRYV
jgi:hypothetical protein